MLIEQFVIVFMFFCLIAGLMMYFFSKNKEIKQVHRYKVEVINKSISLHKEQINFRINNLKGYDFLKYNLQESLIPQAEINPI